MSYKAGEDAILAKVATCAGFNAANTGQAKWRLLNSGLSDNYAILRPGPFNLEWLSPTVYQTTWTTVIEVWQRYKDDGTTQEDLYEHINSLLATLQKWPNMGNLATVQDSSVSGGDEPEEMWNAGGNGPAWLRWKINITWVEQDTVTFSE